MKFGTVPVAQAQGTILAHSVATENGRLRKGVTLDGSHIEQLIQAGLQHVTVAQLTPDDVDENTAAMQLARAIVPDAEAAYLRIGQAATGRVNIFADVPGIVEIDVEKIDALNAINPMITVATVPKWQRMGAGGMVATIKIIAYSVPKSDMHIACTTHANSVRMRPAVLKNAVLIETGPKGDKGARAVGDRLTALGATLAETQTTPHQIEPLADAVGEAKADVIFILTASATSDINDTAPAALRAAGGTVTHFGMPVDPGNLLFLGDLNGTPVIGLPGCARSPALNGADWIMERVICGVPVTSADIMGMGVGGLLKDIPQRGRPRGNS